MEPTVIHPIAAAREMLDVSIVLPVSNEASNLQDCYRELIEVLGSRNLAFEMIFVDDGSQDRSFEVLRDLAHEDPRVVVLRLGRNFGQTAAFTAGVDHARGRAVVFMDADLQNDPHDIPRLLNLLDRGYDVICGWRKRRKDRRITRILPSRIANRLISSVSGVPLHDYGCSLKVFRTCLLRRVHLYGEMHRFIPIFLAATGARITEVEVNHRPRVHGSSSYGLTRIYKVIVDLLLIRFLFRYETKPIHVFGAFSLLNFVVGILAAALAVYFKATGQKDFVQTPLPLLTALTFLMGVISLFMGFIAEILVRTYYESQAKPPYIIAESLNTPDVR
jgi:glycosyltransferase involved in cell wall biosynthesis